MARSRNRPKSRPQLVARRRWDWRRVAGGVAEFCRNVALIAFSTPFVEPYLAGGSIDVGRAVGGSVVGFAFLTGALIFDHERRD